MCGAPAERGAVTAIVPLTGPRRAVMREHLEEERRGPAAPRAAGPAGPNDHIHFLAIHAYQAGYISPW